MDKFIYYLAIFFLYINCFTCLSMKIYPSVIYPVKSGIGCVISSLGIVRIGIYVIDPFLPVTLPALS